MHGLAVALASLGQICVRTGDLPRAERALRRALDVRSPVQFHETTGAVFDTLAQIHLVRGEYDEAESCLQKASEAYGTYGLQASRWYEWSVRLLTARLALRRGRRADALQQATEIATTAGVPPGEAVQAELLAVEALLADERRRRGRATPGHRSARASIRGRRRDRGASTCGCGPTSTCAAAAPPTRTTTSRRASSMFDLLGERYQAAQSRLALGRLVGPGRRTLGRRAPPARRGGGLRVDGRAAGRRGGAGERRASRSRHGERRRTSRRPARPTT